MVAAGLRLAMSSGKVREDMMVWGYRNVWFEFLPSDATIMMPVSKADLQLMHDTFMACFTTQKTAQFPSPSYDGPFSAWAIEIQEKQRRLLGQLLGEEYMCTHIDERVRNSEGFVFVNAMYAKEFLSEVRDLSSKLQSK